MTIIKEFFRNMFMSGKPIFRIDRNRYTHTRRDFPELKDIMDLSKLEFRGLESDELNLARDRSNVIGDLERAFTAYKKERLSRSHHEKGTR